MALQMIKITAYEDKNFTKLSSGNEYSAMMNPESMTWQKTVEYTDEVVPDTSNPSPKFKSILADKLSFDIIIDCTGVVDGTRTNMINEITKLENTIYTYNGDIHRPNFVNVRWGIGISFYGVLESFNTNFTLFKPDGTPLRAKVSLGFTSYMSPEKVKKVDAPKSPDITHLVTVQEGMTLPQLCQQVWNDDSYYIQVAGYNDLNKFRNLRNVHTLIFPPIIQPV